MNRIQEQRLQERVQMNEQISYMEDICGDVYRAKICDVSRSGLGLISDLPYLPDTRLYIRQVGIDRMIIQGGKVVWSQEVSRFDKEHPRYRIGLVFTSI